MLKFGLTFLLTVSVALAQAPPVTPNLGLYKPLQGTLNWGTYVNSNWDTLDSFSGGFTIKNSANFSGGDCGASINAAYAALPPTGGIITVYRSCFFTTPILFGTNGKPVALIGAPGGAVTMTYAGTSGTAITLDYGTGLMMGHGIRDLTLTGPGNSTSTVGVQVGGFFGAQGFDIRDFKIESFGTNVLMGSQTLGRNVLSWDDSRRRYKFSRSLGSSKCW
jgi:hypothetical protein